MNDHTPAIPIAIGLDTGDRPPPSASLKPGAHKSDWENIPYLALLMGDVMSILLHIEREGVMPVHGLSKLAHRIQVLLWELGVLQKPSLQKAGEYTLSIIGEKLLLMTKSTKELVLGVLDRQQEPTRPRFVKYSHRTGKRMYAMDFSVGEMAIAIVTLAGRFKLRDEYLYKSGERYIQYETARKRVTDIPSPSTGTDAILSIISPILGRRTDG